MLGVRQGCVISSHLFNVYREHIMWLALTDLDCEVSIAGLCINELRYADATVLITQSVEEMSHMFQCIKSISEFYGLFLNIQKHKSDGDWQCG